MDAKDLRYEWPASEWHAHFPGNLRECPNDPAHTVRRVRRSGPRYVCYQCKQRRVNRRKYLARTDAQRARAALMSKRTRLRNKLAEVQADLIAVELRLGSVQADADRLQPRGAVDGERPGRGRQRA